MSPAAGPWNGGDAGALTFDAGAVMPSNYRGMSSFMDTPAGRAPLAPSVTLVPL